jgi:hypothetical protein
MHKRGARTQAGTGTIIVPVSLPQVTLSHQHQRSLNACCRPCKHRDWDSESVYCRHWCGRDPRGVVERSKQPRVVRGLDCLALHPPKQWGHASPLCLVSRESRARGFDSRNGRTDRIRRRDLAPQLTRHSGRPRANAARELSVHSRRPLVNTERELSVHSGRPRANTAREFSVCTVLLISQSMHAGEFTQQRIFPHVQLAPLQIEKTVSAARLAYQGLHV